MREPPAEVFGGQKILTKSTVYFLSTNTSGELAEGQGGRAPTTPTREARRNPYPI
jgi:hypothetical protein